MKRGRRGVALLDAILGGVMLGIGLAVILSLASRAVVAQAHGQKQIVASWLLDEMLSMVTVEGPQYYGQLHPTSGRFDEPFDAFSFDVAIEDIGLRRPYKVTASVSWEHAGRERLVQAQTFISERQGDPIEIRAPLEPIDRIGRWYDDE